MPTLLIHRIYCTVHRKCVPLALLFLLGCSYALAWFITVDPGLVNAQEGDLPPLIEIVQEGDDIHISWRVDVEQPADASALDGTLSDDWRWSELEGYILPFATITIALSGTAALVPRVDVVENIPWARDLTLAEDPEMRSPEGEALPNLDPTAGPALPTSPVFVAREGKRRGVRFAVIIISPIFEQDGAPILATVVEAVIPSAQLEGDPQSPASPLATPPESPLAQRDNVQDAAVSPLATPIVTPVATATVEPTITPTSTLVFSDTTTLTATATATNTVVPLPTATISPATPTSTAPPHTPTATATATSTVTQTTLPTASPTDSPTARPISSPTPSPTLLPNTATSTVVETFTPLAPPAQSAAVLPADADVAATIEADSAQGNQGQTLLLETRNWARSVNSIGLGAAFLAILFMGVVAILWRNIEE